MDGLRARLSPQPFSQLGTSLYPSLTEHVTDPEVLRVVLSIGSTEAMHFQTWSEKASGPRR